MHLPLAYLASSKQPILGWSMSLLSPCAVQAGSEDTGCAPQKRSSGRIRGAMAELSCRRTIQAMLTYVLMTQSNTPTP